MSDPKVWTCNPVFNQFKYVPVMVTEVPYMGCMSFLMYISVTILK